MNLYKNYKLFEIFVLGILSGIPLSIIYSTLAAWLKECNISLELITAFAIARSPYSLKFLWAPLTDCIKIPVLEKFGQRKSWMIVCTCLITIIVFMLSFIEPQYSLSELYTVILILGICSATFDLNFDAFRIEQFSSDMQAIAAANAVLGYRIGMLISGGGVLYCADILDSWFKAFVLLGIVLVCLLIFLLSVKDKSKPPVEVLSVKKFMSEIIGSFKDFLTKRNAILILTVVVLFKLGEAMLGVVSMPFYLELGYKKGQIATIVKGFGLVATLVGTYAGGLMIFKYKNNYTSLIIAGIFQSLTHIAFIWLNHQQVSNNALMTAISIENFGNGIGTAALIAYISNLCNKRYSAGQYAILSSLASLANNTVTAFGGSLVIAMGWDKFFIFTMVLAVPSILLLIYLNSIVKNKDLYTSEI
ncbi:MAG: MFS transporter [Rickettsiaceae bacterium]|nr:MAG: MFS transporter [Rickettsiaceae bacterium]